MKLGVLLALLLAGSAQAHNSLQVDFGNLRDPMGDLLTEETLVLLIADSSGDSNLPSPDDFLGAELREGQSIAGDTIFLTGTTISDPLISPDPSNDFALFKGLANVDYVFLDIEEGDLWGVYWFPGLADEGDIVQAGQGYGFYQSSLIDPTTVPFGATSAMTFPADETGGSHMTIYYDEVTLTGLGIEPDPYLTPTAGDFTASYVVVPEPASVLLASIGTLLLLGSRRRHC